MRAINSGKLRAIRDNKNQWRINKDDLREWGAHTVRTPEDAPETAPEAQPAHASTDPDYVSDLKSSLAAERVRAEAAERARDQAEKDRDRWQAIAEKLATQPTVGFLQRIFFRNR